MKESRYGRQGREAWGFSYSRSFLHPTIRRYKEETGEGHLEVKGRKEGGVHQELREVKEEGIH